MNEDIIKNMNAIINGIIPDPICRIIYQYILKPLPFLEEFKNKVKILGGFKKLKKSKDLSYVNDGRRFIIIKSPSGFYLGTMFWYLHSPKRDIIQLLFDRTNRRREEMGLFPDWKFYNTSCNRCWIGY